MEQIKLKTFTAETLELLEKNINAFLSSEEATNLKLVNITIKEIKEDSQIMKKNSMQF